MVKEKSAEDADFFSTTLTILDKIKGKRISLHFNCMTAYGTLDIVSSHLQRQIYVEKEEKIINRAMNTCVFL